MMVLCVVVVVVVVVVVFIVVMLFGVIYYNLCFEFVPRLIFLHAFWTGGFLKSSEAPIDMDELSRKVATNLKIDMDKHGVTTTAQWVISLRTNQKLLYRQELDKFLLPDKLGWICCDDPFNFPTLGTAESPRENWGSGTQAYVTGQLRRINQATHLHAGKKDGTGFVKAKQALNLQSFPDPDAYKRTSFGPRKPDVVAYTDKDLRGALAITLIGDVKGASSLGDFPDAEIGQILDLAKTLLGSYQVFRRVLYCFLTDGNRFQFFRVERRIDGFFFHQSSVFYNTKGWLILLRLLRSDLPALGYEALSVQGVSILEYLGRGGSCVALKGKLDSGETDAVVVKVFEGEDEEAMNNEQSMLTTLSEIENIPKCLGVFPVLVDGQLSTKKALVCSPVGDVVLPIKYGRSSRGSHLSDLVTILEQAHRKGIVHRDVKPENIFLVNDTVLLNDWGISCEGSDEFIPWKGTEAYCDPPTRNDTHCPRPASDLRSLVRCAYAMTVLETEVPRNMDFWACRLASGLWKRGMDAADMLDYNALRIFFQDLRY